MGTAPLNAAQGKALGSPLAGTDAPAPPPTICAGTHTIRTGAGTPGEGAHGPWGATGTDGTGGGRRMSLVPSTAHTLLSSQWSPVGAQAQPHPMTSLGCLAPCWVPGVRGGPQLTDLRLVLLAAYLEASPLPSKPGGLPSPAVRANSLKHTSSIHLPTYLPGLPTYPPI